MITEPVYLEKVPSIISAEELPQKILVPNPGNRRVVIKPEESGWEEEQVFTSCDLPDEIPYELLKPWESSDNWDYPRYVSSVVTNKGLWLAGEKGIKNGISIIDKIAWGLVWQKKTIEVESIREPDLELFDHRSERLLYWLAPSKSQSNDIDDDYFWPGVVYEGYVACSRGLLLCSNNSSRFLKAAVRPVITLTTIVL